MLSNHSTRAPDLEPASLNSWLIEYGHRETFKEKETMPGLEVMDVLLDGPAKNITHYQNQKAYSILRILSTGSPACCPNTYSSYLA